MIPQTAEGSESRRPHLSALVGLPLIAVVGSLDLATGLDVSVAVFYLVPVALLAWGAGLRPALAAAILSGLVWLTCNHWLAAHDESSRVLYWNALVRSASFSVVAGAVAHLRSALDRERRALRELAAAYSTLDQSRKAQLLMKDQLLSHVSHELRTPLAASTEFMNLMRDGFAGPLTNTQREYLDIGLRNSGQLARMIQDLLDATRAEAGGLQVDAQPSAIEPIIDGVASGFRAAASARSVALSIDIAPDLPTVVADTGRIGQVLCNLIDNALKFTPAGGSVTVRARPLLAADEVGVQVEVSDSGCGIALDAQDRLFQRLSQVGNAEQSRKGLGLGLYISKELVSRHGGRLWVVSEPGQGSTFSFSLPAATASPGTLEVA